MTKETILEDFGNNSYSGILQLRCANSNKLNRIMDFVRKGGGLCKIVLAKKGYDIFIGPHKVMNKLSRQLPKQFGGKLTITKQLVTRRRQTSKEVYRLYVLFRAFPYDGGDIVDFGGKPIKLTSTSSKINGIDISSGKRTVIPADGKLQKLDVLDAVVSQYKPNLMLINPLSFQPVRPENQPESTAKRYKVVLINEKLFVVK